MRVSARVDYAVRALVQLAADDSTVPIKAEHLATSQSIPPKFLLEILRQLKQKKLLVSRRGPLETVSLEDVRTGRLPRHVVTTADKYGVDERP